MSQAELRRFSTYLKPQGWLEISAFLAVVGRSLLYWIVAALQLQEPLSVTALYRVGDIEYFPLVTALSKLQFGEFALKELQGTGLSSFPFASVWLHALLYRFLGVWGYIAADALVAVVYYGALALVLQVLGVAKRWALVGSLLVVTGVVGTLGSGLSEGMFAAVIYPYQAIVTPILMALLLGFAFLSKRYQTKKVLWAFLPVAIVMFSGLSLNLWGWRIPRPFVTEIYFLACIGLMGWMMNSSVTNRWGWLGLGLATAALLQGDLHSAIIMAIAIGALGIYQFQHHPGLNPIRNLLLCGVSFALGSWPFFLQRRAENLDVPVRLGVFSHDRLHPLFLPGQMPYILVAGVIVFGLLLRRWTQDSKQQRGIELLCGLGIVACFALPISFVVLGKGVQLYHFLDRLTRVLALALLVFSLQFASGVQRPAVTPEIKRLLSLGLIGLSIALPLREATQLTRVSQHMRSDFPEYQALPNYRQNFTALVQELSKPEYQTVQVLGTLDIQVYAWWVAFRQGFSFLPEAPLTTVGDAEIEERLGIFCRLIGMNTGDFQALLQRNFTHIFWLGHDKHQASGAHRFAPLSDYDPPVQAMIRRTGILNSLNIALPNSERDRLTQQFQALGTKPLRARRLDLIILGTDASVRDFAPPPALFEPLYQNAAFRVWRRKGN
jgi:hypothetical protein